MKQLTLILLLVPLLAFCQQNTNTAPDTKVSWEIRGAEIRMTKEFHRESQRSYEEIHVSILKNKTATRPEGIAVTIPFDAINDHGIVLAFYSKEKNRVERISAKFPACEGGLCTFSFKNGCVQNELTGKEADVFEKFKNFEYLYVSFKDSQDLFSVIEIPLKDFSDAYSRLK
ncbi:MAG: hypothetical protein EOO48_11765 [Flavobacterium sp.]|nr:MAG: hypothetical protein EOO48_11765 [Flavobacterium sp.]